MKYDLDSIKKVAGTAALTGLALIALGGCKGEGVGIIGNEGYGRSDFTSQKVKKDERPNQASYMKDQNKNNLPGGDIDAGAGYRWKF